MKIEILYEDKNYLVLNKPTGLVVHSDGKTTEETLVDWVMENYPEIENVGEPLELSSGEIIKRPGVIHRLDKATSGVIALAKNQEAYEHLKKQFKERKTTKVYKTFVHGVLKNDEGKIDRAIGRSAKFGLWSAQRGIRGKEREALTEYRVLKRAKDTTFLEVIPKTGRTHQIRVHLKAINHPVVCDNLYNPKAECLLGFERLALHAEKLEFLGLDGTKIEVISALPEDFLEAQKQL